MKLVGERRALAVLVMGFFFLMATLNAIAAADQMPEFVKLFAAIAGVYGLAFFSLVAGYFWARWYAIGVGLFGVIMGVIGIWQTGGAHPVFVFIGGTHLAATVLLWGEAMAEPYDGQLAWREKWHMDDNAVQRLGRSVIRAGVSLPFILMYAFTPRPEGLVVPLVAVGLAVFGLRGLVKMKTWGVVAIGAAGTLLVATSAVSLLGGTPAAVAPLAGGVMLLAATAPFAAPMTRWLLAR